MADRRSPGCPSRACGQDPGQSAGGHSVGCPPGSPRRLHGPHPHLLVPRPAVEPIARVQFVDGNTRPVFEADGRQFVVDDAGERVYGVWYIPPDDRVPIIVEPGGGPAEEF